MLSGASMRGRCALRTRPTSGSGIRGAPCRSPPRTAVVVVRASSSLPHMAAAAATSSSSSGVAQPQLQLQETSRAQLTRRGVLVSTAAAACAAAGSSLAAAPACAAAAATAAATTSGRVPHVSIAPDLEISRIIKGCWQLSGGHKGERDSDRTAGDAAVQDFGAFAAAGVTTWDAADHYGPAETLIGRYLAAHPEQRKDLQIATKVCFFRESEMRGVSKASVAAAVDTCRRRLGVDTIDLVQLYWGEYAIPRYVDAALYLADEQAKGHIRCLGATNFDVPRMEAMLDAGVPFVAHQVQYSLLDQRPANGMAQLCQERGVGLLPYGVLAGGFLADRYLGVPAAEVSVNTYSKGKYAQVLGQSGGWAWLQGLLAAMGPVAQRHGVTIAVVAARWVLQRPGVPAIILGARNASHVPDMARVFEFELGEVDLGAIQEALDKGRPARGDCYDFERGGIW